MIEKMTKSQLSNGHRLLDKIETLKNIKRSLKEQFPQWTYSLEAKELLGDEVNALIDSKIQRFEKEFEEL